MSDIERYGLRPNVAAALQADAGMPEEKISLSDLIHILRKRKATILGLAAGTLMVTTALTVLQKPIYQAKTLLMVQTKKMPFSDNKQEMPGLSDMMGLNAQRTVGNEVEVLQSRDLTERAIVEADSPKIQKLRARIAARDRQRESLLRSEDSTQALQKLDAADRRDQDVIDNEAERLLDARKQLLEDPKGKLPRKDPKLSVEVLKESDLINVAVEDTDRIRAQNVANFLVANYLDQNSRLNSASARKARQFVEVEMVQVKRDLTRAEEGLRRYKEHAHSIDIGEETKEAVDRMAELVGQQKIAESENKGLEATVATLRGQLLKTPAHVQSSVLQVRNPVIGELEKTIAQLQVQKAGLLKEFQPTTPEIQNVDAQIRKAQDQMGEAVQSEIGEKAVTLNPVYPDLLKGYMEAEAQRLSIHAKMVGLGQAVAIGRAELQQVPSRALRLAELTRTAQVLDHTYTLLNEKFQELRVGEAAQLPNARVVDAALKPQKPIRPNKPLNLMLGLSFGLMLGLAIAFLQEQLDNSVKTPDQLEREFGLPTLGMLGDIRQGEDRVISAARPQAALAEALRMIRSSLQFAAVDGQLQSMLVTSAVPGEGKSTIAANLALVMAQKGLRVVLVDADMRSPRQHRIFELPNTVGLSSVIVGQSSIEDAAHVHPDCHLMILTSGPMPPNPAELLESARARDLIQQLKASCDMVIFDSPPCTTMVDGSSLAAQVDGAILVVRAGHTPRVAVARACQLLRETGTRLLGTILNRVTAQTDQYYYYAYSYQYYYSNYDEPESTRRPALARSGSRSGRDRNEGR